MLNALLAHQPGRSEGVSNAYKRLVVLPTAALVRRRAGSSRGKSVQVRRRLRGRRPKQLLP